MWLVPSASFLARRAACVLAANGRQPRYIIHTEQLQPMRSLRGAPSAISFEDEPIEGGDGQQFKEGDGFSRFRRSREQRGDSVEGGQPSLVRGEVIQDESTREFSKFGKGSKTKHFVQSNETTAKSSAPPPKIINLAPPRERPENPVPQKVFSQDEQSLFAGVPEIVQEDALQDFRSSHFDADFLDTVGSGIAPSYNVAALSEKVEVLQKLILFGVDMHKWDSKPWLVQKVLGLSWKHDCEPRIQLLTQVAGVQPEDLSKMISKNPSILHEDIQHLTARLEFLSDTEGGWALARSDVARIVSKDPFWLSFSVERLENRIDFFKNQLSLVDADIKSLMVRCPKVITSNLRSIIVHKFAFTEQMGWTRDEVRQVVLRAPRLLLQNKESVAGRFEILHNEIGYDHKMLATVPQVLFSREKRLEERVAFLRHLDRGQFDPSQPGFVSSMDLACLNDEKFVRTVAKSSLEDFERFLKTR